MRHPTVAPSAALTMPDRIQDPHARAEARLRLSEQRFRNIFENAAVGIAEVGLDGRFVTVNDKLCEITGYPRDELLRLTFQDITHPDDLAADIAFASRITSGEIQQYSMEKRYICPDGAVVFVNLSASAVRGVDDEVVHFVAIVEDITERRLAEDAMRASEQQLRSVFDHAATGIAITDMDGRFLECNPAYQRLLGYSQEELRNLRFAELVHPEDRAANVSLVEALRRPGGSHVEIENRYIHRSGRPVWVHKFIALLYDANHVPDRVMALVTDITGQRARQETQREEMRQKDEFIAVLAHELRNPLAPIRTSVAVLQRLGSTDATLVRCRDVIDRQVGHMARLIDDLLDVSRLSRGELRLQKAAVPLSSILDDASQLAESLMTQQRQRLVTVGVPESLVLHVDAARLTQVIGNLLHNAAKYSPPDTEIRLLVDVTHGQVVIRVRDQGVGIPASQIERVFDLFAQTDNARELRKGGLGIGLALARRLVEMHGGSIVATSPGPGRGSEFSVRLPFDSEAANSATAATTPASATPSSTDTGARRVLVADDNVDAAEMIGVLFEQAGCEVRRVHDGESAVLEAERFKPDIAVLDLGMPGMDGHEACQRIRREPWGATMHIVALTGRGQESDKRLSLLSGFNQHLVKPVDTDALLQLLQVS
ncbi:MAG: PAS domain S-box protein [Vicinamibacterales bacterium]